MTAELCDQVDGLGGPPPEAERNKTNLTKGAEDDNLATSLQTSVHGGGGKATHGNRPCSACTIYKQIG